MINSVNKTNKKCPNNTVQYVVKSGDTLYKIATRNKTSIEVLLELNPELNTNLLIPGIVMCIPANVTVPPTTPPEGKPTCPGNVAPIMQPDGLPTCPGNVLPTVPPSGAPVPPLAPFEAMPIPQTTPSSGSETPVSPIASSPWIRPIPPMTPPSGTPMQPMMPPSGTPMQPMMPPSGTPMQPMMPPSGTPTQPMMPSPRTPMQPMMPPSGTPTQPMMPPSGTPTQPMMPPSGTPTQPMMPPSGRPVPPTMPPSGAPVPPMMPPSGTQLQPPGGMPIPQTMPPAELECSGQMRYTIKHGDTLYNLAKRHDITLFELLSANRNVNPYNLQAGQVICIPVSTARCPYGKIYTVAAGDTLATILARFRISLANLKEVNENFDPYNIKVGARLCIPAFMAFDTCPTERTYVVQAGDNLTRISEGFMITASDLLIFNPNMRPEDFGEVGMKICLPLEGVPLR